MEVVINKWGNSLGIRLPNHVVKKLGLTNGAKLELKDLDGAIILEKPKKLSLTEIIDSYGDDYESRPELFSDNVESEQWEWNPE